VHTKHEAIKNMTLNQRGLVLVVLLGILFGRASSQCSLDNCDSCPDGVHCATCTDEGINGLRVNRTGCDDCYAVSEGTCAACSSLNKCDYCSNADQGVVSNTTTAMCGDCGAHCLICSEAGAGKCDTYACESGYTDIDNICIACTTENCGACYYDNTVCYSCKDGFYLNSSGECTPCKVENCAFCKGDNPACEYCKTGFEVDSSGYCVACTTENCAFCSNNINVCEYCRSGFKLNPSGQCEVRDD